MSDNDAPSVQVLVNDLDADELLEFETCLTATTDHGSDVSIAHRGGALLSELNDIAYTLIVSGLALDYLAGAINRIRLRFGQLTVFDFRNNTLTVSKHPNAGNMAGKALIVGPNGDVTVSKDQDDKALLEALKDVTGQN
jgi:hypothetical protein